MNDTTPQGTPTAFPRLAGSALDRPHFRSIENPEGDWTEDFTHENGEYCNNCVTCKKTFVGHKRRHICKSCATKAQTRWKSLTPEEQAAELAETERQIRAFFSPND